MNHRRSFLLPVLFILFILFYSGMSHRSTRPEDKRRKPGFAAAPSLVFHNANIITMDDALPTAEAVAIEGNRITAVGQDTDILGLAGPITQVIDLEGKTIVPGLIEGHTHVLAQAYQNEGIDGLKRAAEVMASEGFTTVHEMNLWQGGLLDAAVELISKDELAVRINFYPNYGNPDGSFRTDGWWNTHPYTMEVDTLIRIVGVKFYADGGVSGVPGMSVPYMGGSNAGSHGDIWYSQSECDSFVQVIHDAGYPIAVHCIGDSAVGLMLNAFDEVLNGQGNTLRHRMEHCRVMREDLIDQMADLGLVASIQYTWARTENTERYEATYYPEVLECVFPWQRMLDEDIRLVGGNDAPWAALHTQAMQTISLVATRTSEKGRSLASWLDGDQLTVKQAIRSMTTDAAWVCFEEEEKGSITVGKLADLTVLSDDPLSMDPFDVRYIATEMTVMDGVIRYNQLGSEHLAIHDTGTFRLGIDDRGYWGSYRSLVGLEFEGKGHLAAGSLLISYDENTTATALHPQYDFETSDDGGVDFQEPGSFASEEVQVIFEDVMMSHPGQLGVTQQSLMWAGDSSALIRYTFKNIGSSDLDDLYVGQYMDFDMFGWQNTGTWEENDGLGFTYMTNPDSSQGPFIGMAMFDSTGLNVNTGNAYPIPTRFFTGYEEGQTGGQMRNGAMDGSAGDPYDYAMLLSYGPMSLDIDESKSPFTLALAVAKSVDGLKGAMQDAYTRLMSLYDESGVRWNQPDVVKTEPFCQNYPNPFNASTTFHFTLEQSGPVSLEIIDLLGRRVDTLVERRCDAGDQIVHWSAESIPAGVYVYRLRTTAYTLTKKLILQK